MKRFGKLVLAVGALWLFLAILMPLLYVAFSPNQKCDGMLVEVTSVGRFTGGVLSTITYKETPSYRVCVFEHKTVAFSHPAVFAQRNNDGTYTISSYFSSNNNWYTDAYLKKHPELLKEAEDLLKLGLKCFAQAQK